MLVTINSLIMFKITVMTLFIKQFAKKMNEQFGMWNWR